MVKSHELRAFDGDDLHKRNNISEIALSNQHNEYDKDTSELAKAGKKQVLKVCIWLIYSPKNFPDIR